jgi:hypothetical protein
MDENDFKNILAKHSDMSPDSVIQLYLDDLLGAMKEVYEKAYALGALEEF